MKKSNPNRDEVPNKTMNFLIAQTPFKAYMSIPECLNPVHSGDVSIIDQEIPALDKVDQGIPDLDKDTEQRKEEAKTEHMLGSRLQESEFESASIITPETSLYSFASFGKGTYGRSQPWYVKNFRNGGQNSMTQNKCHESENNSCFLSPSSHSSRFEHVNLNGIPFIIDNQQKEDLFNDASFDDSEVWEESDDQDESELSTEFSEDFTMEEGVDNRDAFWSKENFTNDPIVGRESTSPIKEIVVEFGSHMKENEPQTSWKSESDSKANSDLDEHSVEDRNKEQRINLLPFASVTPQNEHLILSMYEAFYLQFALGVLNIHNLDMYQYFQYCQRVDKNFLMRYSVYHYFRSRNWIPRSGMYYGCDFVLYRYGPGIDHGSFCLLCFDETTKDYIMNWRDIQHQNRLNASVGKSLVYCQVEGIPKSEDGSVIHQYNPFNTFRRITVSYTVVSRVIL